MAEIVLTDENFAEEVFTSDIPVLVDFWGNGCGPCRALSPVLEKMAVELDGKVKVGKVNVDDQEELTREYKIMSIPTLKLFRNGKVVRTGIGVKTYSQLLEMVGEEQQ